MDDDDPCTVYRFEVRIRGDAVGGFSEVAGLGFESEVETLRVGGVHGGELQLLGPSKYPTRLVLKRGLSRGSYLWAWYQCVMRGQVDRRPLTVVLCDARRQPVYEWTFDEACPVKWTGPGFQATSSAVAFESIELVHRGVQLPPPPVRVAG